MSKMSKTSETFISLHVSLSLLQHAKMKDGWSFIGRFLSTLTTTQCQREAEEPTHQWIEATGSHHNVSLWFVVDCFEVWNLAVTILLVLNHTQNRTMDHKVKKITLLYRLFSSRLGHSLVN